MWFSNEECLATSPRGMDEVSSLSPPLSFITTSVSQPRLQNWLDRFTVQRCLRIPETFKFANCLGICLSSNANFDKLQVFLQQSFGPVAKSIQNASRSSMASLPFPWSVHSTFGLILTCLSRAKVDWFVRCLGMRRAILS